MAFSRLSESIKKTIAVADGYKLGRLVFENEDSLCSLKKNLNRRHGKSCGKPIPG